MRTQKSNFFGGLHFLLLISVLVLPPIVFIVSPIGTTVPILIARICAVLLIIFSIPHREKFTEFLHRNGRSECIPLIGLVVVFGISLLHPHITPDAAVNYLKLVIGILLYFPLRALIDADDISSIVLLALLANLICGFVVFANNILFYVTDNQLNLVEPVFHRHAEIFLSVVTWPVCLLCKDYFRHRPWLNLLFIIPVFAILTGDNQSSQLALICGLCVFIAAAVCGRITVIFILVSLPVLVLSIVWWVPMIAQLGSLEALSSFFDRGDADARLSIWLAYIELIRTHFWFGWGFEAWRDMPQFAGPNIHLKWHPHNSFIEIWAALGFLGALLIVGFEVYLLLGIYRLENTIRPYFLATFVSANVVAFVSHGLLQTWWIETLFISALILIPIADRSHRA